MDPKNTPILLIIFNRPDKVRKLIETLASVKPTVVYILADGPRPHISSDKERTEAARSAAIDMPWECKIHTNFLEHNVGCHTAVSLGIDWFFKNVEAGIILEDDCIPDPSFFTFCAELLYKYKDNERIMHISGNNFQDGQIRGDGSYYFSLYTHSWGWATWRRAWQCFHPAVEDMKSYIEEDCIKQIPVSNAAQRFWIKSYRSQRHWDSLWQYTVWHENGLSIIPNQNLVTNIGFGEGATNTSDKNNPQANLQTFSIEHIKHPGKITCDAAADEFTFKEIFNVPLWKRVILRVRKELQSFRQRWYNMTARK